MKKKYLNMIGMVAMVVGFAASLVSDWVNEKNIDNLIDEKLSALGINTDGRR